MSGRLTSARLAPLARQALIQSSRASAYMMVRGASYHTLRNASRLFNFRTRPRLVRWREGRQWGSPSSIHAVPSVRYYSFVRVIPKLMLKFARIPAMFGGAMIAGLAYLQYQAAQAGNYAIDVFKRAGEAATDTAGSIFQKVADVVEQTHKGWENTKNDFDVPDWLQKILRTNDASPGSGGDSGGGGSGPKQSGSGMGVGGGVATGAATFGYDESEEDERSVPEAAKDDQMMLLTKKMIEIRNILHTVGQSDTLTLPSIVVIGSQSSGKSSVLEAIVGHEFLPKGTNMVTRRPIELTLVNSPDVRTEYGEFPQLGLGKITDFAQIQRTLTDLNLAVSESECVSDDPIRLHIHSPNVPDLSLIDLPGYIQVVGRDQPLELKQKISDLCDKYIQPPNVILAISAADVDLANSTALRASRRVDPRGERTIGVVTKMDLVNSVRGAQILKDRNYPLRLGYVGVVCKIPQRSKVFTRGNENILPLLTKNENAFFSAHPNEFGVGSNLAVGTTTLRKKLMSVLEQTMASSLQTTGDAVRQELEEATYEFKVQYNDRPLSAESYLAESLDAFKHSFKKFSEEFGRPEVRELLKQELDQRVLDLLAQRYWNKPIDDLEPPLPDPEPLSSLPQSDPDSPSWHRKLDASTSQLTKLGIGRLATTVVANAIQANIDRLISESMFAAHPSARKAITEASMNILNDRFFSTSDQVENCIKPYKFEIEVEDNEWSKGRESISNVLKDELKACEAAEKRVEQVVGGRRKLRDVMSFIDRARNGEVVIEGNGASGAGGFSADLLQKGREAIFLRDRSEILKMRILAMKSKQCGNSKNKYYCPEIFLDIVADKLTSTAVLFLNVELLSEFYYNFPRELDARLGRHLSDQEVEAFAREDPKIRKHLDCIKRKETLELVLEKMESLRQLEGREKRKAKEGRAEASGRERTRTWNLF